MSHLESGEVAVTRGRGPRFWLVAALAFGILLAVAYGIAKTLLLAILVSTMDTGSPWWTELLVLAVLLALPLLLALLLAMGIEAFLGALGFVDRSRLRWFHLAPAVAFIVVPLWLMRGNEIEHDFGPSPPTAASIPQAPLEHPIVDSDSIGFCEPVELASAESLFVFLSVRSPRAGRGRVSLEAHDQNGRSYLAEVGGPMEKGVTRIRLRLEPTDGGPPQVAWPLRVVYAMARVTDESGEERTLDARYGSLAFLSPDRPR